MEKYKEYIVSGLDLDNTVSAVTAVVMALIENSGKGKKLKHLLIISACSFGLAGALIDFIPNPSFYIVLLTGVLVGILTDDLYGRIIQKFPTLTEDVLNVLIEKIKNRINK